MIGFTINRLISGGVITNYSCTSACRHCLYKCSPRRTKNYLDVAAAETIFQTVRRLGCRSVHIGGGEPFLKPDALGDVLDAALRSGVSVEYVETNSSWFTDMDAAVALLRDLAAKGLSTLLISISPFHNEFIPFAKVQGVTKACRIAGINIFPWISDFTRDLSAFDASQPHAMGEFVEKFGKNYLPGILNRYWIHMGGRAPDTFRPYLPLTPVSDILKEKPGNCARNLSDASHFHIDLHGRYIPGLCSGLGIAAEDLGTPLDPEKYPLIMTLYAAGVRGLCEFAGKRFGYAPRRNAYINKCDLCGEIRQHLADEEYDDSGELHPAGFYNV